MDSIGKYLISVAAAAIICGIVENLYPKESGSGVIVKMMCGAFMVLSAVSPWLKLPVYDFTAYAQSFSQQADDASHWGMEEADEYRRSLISEKVSTYILDKAAQLEVQIEVDVMLTEDELSIPCGVTIKGSVPQEKKGQLEHILASELGIGRSDQIWIE